MPVAPRTPPARLRASGTAMGAGTTRSFRAIIGWCPPVPSNAIHGYLAQAVEGHLAVVIDWSGSSNVEWSRWHGWPSDHHRSVYRREGSRLRRRLSCAVHLRIRPGEERAVLRG